MTSWYERRDDADEYAPCDLDELTEQLLTLVRPEPREPACDRCGFELRDTACDFCGNLQGRRQAA